MAQNPNIDDDTRARARKFVEDKAEPAKKSVEDKAEPAKKRVVGKKELEDSGLSLRDFLNKERGLTRRGSKAAPTAGATDSGKSSAERRSAIRMKDVQPSDRTKMDAAMSGYNPRTGPLSDVTRPGTSVTYDNTDTSDMGMKRGGKVKKMASGGMTSSASKRADGCAVKGKTKGKML